MSDFSSRLREERKRLGLSQEALADLGGIKLNAQSNYETAKRAPDADYLSRVAAHGVDVAYVITGHRMLVMGDGEPLAAPAPDPSKYRPSQRAAPHIASERASPAWLSQKTTQRQVTSEEAVLLDNYAAADERGRAAAWTVLDALAKRNQTSE